MNSEVSSELRALLFGKLDTFEKLELVLALRSAGTPLTLGQLALQLQVGHKELRRVADGVVATGIIEHLDNEMVQFCSGTWDPLIAEAADWYGREPRLLMKMFTTIAMNQLRGEAARTFADAFLVRKKGD